ncbi:MAG: hypothetical protein ACKV19_20895, partial [Verrucomicrobiales bacterium]
MRFQTSTRLLGCVLLGLLPILAACHSKQDEAGSRPATPPAAEDESQAPAGGPLSAQPAGPLEPSPAASVPADKRAATAPALSGQNLIDPLRSAYERMDPSKDGW